jgi:hypothetical protein
LDQSQSLGGTEVQLPGALEGRGLQDIAEQGYKRGARPNGSS